MHKEKVKLNETIDSKIKQIESLEYRVTELQVINDELNDKLKLVEEEK